MNVSLGGKAFAVADLEKMTFAQAHYLMGQVRQGGLDRIWPIEGESDADYEARLRFGIIDAGNVPQVLAGYLIPEDRPWTETVARETARHLAGVTDRAEHEAMLGLAQDVAPDFFARALEWHGISRLYLNGSRPGSQPSTSVQ